MNNASAGASEPHSILKRENVSAPATPATPRQSFALVAPRTPSSGRRVMFEPTTPTTPTTPNTPRTPVRPYTSAAAFHPSVPGGSGRQSVPLTPRHANKKTNNLYKTEMCRNWSEVGECKYGKSCQFAHGAQELRVVQRHGQWKTKTCLAWVNGGCTYGSRCCYARKSSRSLPP
ncbi:hypothetical protein BZA05DRAFT_374237 [Tricharina praecox]|uniref:uncharacterized protein n=1 Tax=Tricharina praecox TaxID=43433 RepID=UPI00221E846A|nr:uncharacterized protein BZA05DRAFT_374237 [Tricharina praecox]KAI5850609.1 hypothetical protein BZA05DRAFT_374237 [Tricharina praecox]